MRDRCIDLQRLFGDLLLAFRGKSFQGAHVVQPVGEFDDDHADVVHHRQHHLADVLRLALFLGSEIDLADLGDAFHDVRHLRAELALNVLDGDDGVFHRIMQQPGGDVADLRFEGSERNFLQGAAEGGFQAGQLGAIVRGDA